MGDGVTFPQRHMDEDEDSLLGARSQRWMEEGGVENTRLETNPYRKFFKTIQWFSLLTVFFFFFRCSELGSFSPDGLKAEYLPKSFPFAIFGFSLHTRALLCVLTGGNSLRHLFCPTFDAWSHSHVQFQLSLIPILFFCLFYLCVCV